MLINVLPIWFTLAIYNYVECLEPKDTNRDIDPSVVPPTYQVINNNYDYEFDTTLFYSTPNPIEYTATERFAIQYAPLEIADVNYHRPSHNPNRTEPPTIEYNSKKPKVLVEKDYLQPKWVSINVAERHPKARSFFSGHGVSVLQSSSKAHGHNDLYRTYHNHVDQSKIRNMVYSSFQNPRQGTPEEELLPDGRTILYLPGSGQNSPLQEKKYIRKFVPFVLTKPFLHGAKAKSQGPSQNPTISNKLPNSISEKTPLVNAQALSALSPGLHLNLARVYGIAHTNDQRHINVPHRSMEKPAIMNKKSVDKKKIILHL